MEQVAVVVNDEAVNINVFAKLGQRLFIYGYGMKDNGTVVIVKAKYDEQPRSATFYKSVGEVYAIKRLRRGQEENYRASKAQYGTIMGSCEVTNFFAEHDLPKEAESYILGKVLELWRSYPKAEMVIDIPKEELK